MQNAGTLATSLKPITDLATEGSGRAGKGKKVEGRESHFGSWQKGSSL
jgi:hypothetical protein